MADQESSDAQAVRALMRERAAGLAGFATLNVVSLDQEDEAIELVPANPRAARVTVTHSPGVVDGEVFVSVGGETTDMPGLTDRGLRWLDDIIDAAVHGRVVLYEGAGRRRTEITYLGGGVSPATDHALLRGCMPSLGWRRRAKVTRFEPYADRRSV